MHIEKIMTRWLFLLLLWPLSSFGADVNGYTAQYECRAGGTYCNVDVVTLANQACQQIITPSTAPTTNWTALNQANTIICIEAGDHTARGTLTLTTSGNSGARKVLRYYRASDNNDEPWAQSAGNRAKIRKIVVEGNYWIVHRLTVDYPNTSSIVFVEVGNDIIFNRMLIQGAAANIVRLAGDSKQNRTVQNSVIRQNIVAVGAERHCFQIAGTTLHTRIINNEIYDCATDGLQTSLNSLPRGVIIENNDIYQTSAMYCDADGTPNPSGVRSGGENGLDLKEAGDDPAYPLRAIHNRIWGFRYTDTSCGSSGSNGEAIVFHSNTDSVPGATNSYGLIQNNILFDGTTGINSPNRTPTRYSIVGNLIYNMTYFPTTILYAIDESKADTTEIYLNTIISADNGIDAGGAGNDARCNVLISTGGMAGTPIDYNVYLDVSGTKPDTNKIDLSLVTRSNSTSYALNQIMRTSSTPTTGCINGTEPACFLYMATTGGISAATPPTPCTTLGCSYTDGAVTWKAIRGPYIFKRKLRTVAAGENYAVAYARADLSAPDYGTCPNTMANRKSIGISDEEPTW